MLPPAITQDEVNMLRVLNKKIHDRSTYLRGLFQIDRHTYKLSNQFSSCLELIGASMKAKTVKYPIRILSTSPLPNKDTPTFSYATGGKVCWYRDQKELFDLIYPALMSDDDLDVFIERNNFKIYSKSQSKFLFSMLFSEVEKDHCTDKELFAYTLEKLKDLTLLYAEYLKSQKPLLLNNGDELHILHNSNYVKRGEDFVYFTNAFYSLDIRDFADEYIPSYRNIQMVGMNMHSIAEEYLPYLEASKAAKDKLYLQLSANDEDLSNKCSGMRMLHEIKKSVKH